MSAIAVEPAKFENTKYVQHVFDWDAPLVEEHRCVTSNQSVAPQITSARSSVECTADTPTRRGRCEHVGSVMAVVLGKYGLGIDDLLRAIEERQAQVGVSR